MSQGEAPGGADGGGSWAKASPSILLLVLTPQPSTLPPGSHRALAAQGLRRELPAALRSAGGGLEVSKLMFASGAAFSRARQALDPSCDR